MLISSGHWQRNGAYSPLTRFPEYWRVPQFLLRGTTLIKARASNAAAPFFVWLCAASKEGQS